MQVTGKLRKVCVKLRKVGDLKEKFVKSHLPSPHLVRKSQARVNASGMESAIIGALWSGVTFASYFPQSPGRAFPSFF